MKGCTLTPQDIQLLAKLLDGVKISVKTKTTRTTKNNWKCVKCKKDYYIHRHHVTYDPAVIKLLCRNCHGLITSINYVGSIVAGGNKDTRTKYTNTLRWVLWKWFLKTDFPKGTKRVSKTVVRNALRDAGFKIEPRG